MAHNGDHSTSFWDKLKILSQVVATVVIPVTIALVSQRYADAMQRREVQVRYLELATDILKGSMAPTEASAGLRLWAVNIVDRYSPLKLDKQARDALLKGPWRIIAAEEAKETAVRLGHVVRSGEVLTVIPDLKPESSSKYVK
jgi:hypothetical protein